MVLTIAAHVTANLPASGLDPTIVAALIGAAGVIIVACIGGAFAIYQLRRNAQLQKEVARYQKELDEDSQRKDRIRRDQEAETKAAQTEMRHARTLDEQAQAYRKALHADPRIARLHILDMNRPLDVAEIYIPVQLHEETKPGYDLDPVLQNVAAERDPNALIQANRLLRERRSSKALAPREAIRTHKQCMIVGDPGAGKTTLLKYLTLQSADGKLVDLPDLPILIELHAFATSGQLDLLAFAAVVWQERYGFPKTIALAYMQQQLRDGKAILLMDALDETVAGTTRDLAEASYRKTSNAIIDLATRYHQAPIVVTARKAGYHQRAKLTGFTELEVLDFRPQDITQFVEQWFACHPELHVRGNAADLTAKLERSPRIQALATNPLLLSLIVIVYEDQLDLPDRRAELYKLCVDVLLSKWDASRNIHRRREFKPEQKRQLLEEVAWHFHRQGQRYFAERELLGVIAGFLPAIGLPPEQNGQILDEIAAENGLLKEQAHGWYGLLHLTLQEYFVAQYAVDHQELETIIDNRDDPWWEEVVLLYAGRVSDASLLLQRLLGVARDKLRDDLFHTNLLLAGSCLAAYPTVRQASLREEIVARLFQRVTTSSYRLERQHCAETLAEIGGTKVDETLKVNERLLSLLSNEQVDVWVRELIAEALGTLGERSVAPQLVALLSNEQVDGWVRERIAEALGTLGERSVAPQLVALLSNEQVDVGVRGLIAGALGTLGERSVAPQLVALLSNEQVDGWVRGRIAGALGTLGERSVAPQLVALLSNEQVDVGVRGNIAEALGTLGERSVAPQLVALLSNEQVDGWVRWNIAGALGTLGERSVAPQLVALLSNEQVDGWVRGRIAGALGTLGERSVAPQLVALLSNKQVDGSVRERIAGALGTLGERSVAPQLVALLSNEQVDGSVRERIAGALGTLGERSVAPQLVALLSNKQVDGSVRGSIAEALIKLVNDEEQVRALAALFLASDIPDALYTALWSLSRQVGVRIYVVDGTDGKHLTVEKRSLTRNEA